MPATGVRISCAASATKRRWRSTEVSSETSISFSVPPSRASSSAPRPSSRGPADQVLADRALQVHAGALLDAEHGPAVRSDDGPAPLIQPGDAAGPGGHRRAAGQDVGARSAGIQQADGVTPGERDVLAVRGPGQRVGVHAHPDHAAAGDRHAPGAGAGTPGPFGPGGQVEHVELFGVPQALAHASG